MEVQFCEMRHRVTGYTFTKFPKKPTAVSYKDIGCLTSPPECAKTSYFLMTFIETFTGVLKVLCQKKNGQFEKAHFIFGMWMKCGGTQWHNGLRNCATSRQVAGSIPDGVIGIFY